MDIENGVSKEEVPDYKLLIDTAALAGMIMLENGAEISSVEVPLRQRLSISFKVSASATRPLIYWCISLLILRTWTISLMPYSRRLAIITRIVLLMLAKSTAV